VPLRRGRDGETRRQDPPRWFRAWLAGRVRQP